MKAKYLMLAVEHNGDLWHGIFRTDGTAGQSEPRLGVADPQPGRLRNQPRRPPSWRHP
jgi:hypothetical protein